MYLILCYICNNLNDKVVYVVTYNCTRQQAVLITIGGNKADNKDNNNGNINEKRNINRFHTVTPNLTIAFFFY